MACFIAPATVAIATTAVRKIVKKREEVAVNDRPETSGAETSGADTFGAGLSGKWTQRLGWLNTMLWGGTLMLVLDHLMSGELTFQPPFLTALQTPAQVGSMLREILVTGGAMTGAVLVVWAGIVIFSVVRSKAKLAREA